MNDTFFISDTHFGDKTICEYHPVHRPFSSIEEHDEELVRRWNGVVGKTDIVWHIGDFAVGSIAIAGRLNGKKHLILGNHDMRKPAEYAKYFERVFGMVRYQEPLFLLSHIPVHPAQLYQCKFNIHGHMHQGEMPDDNRYFNVSCERINLTPMPYEELLNQLQR
ncbi:MAG TPA: hypothetical protein VFT64_09945 [Rickettsiales bacterium]|nr:hypothetical protein [Rickettsiales bacterium]